MLHLIVFIKNESVGMKNTLTFKIKSLLTKTVFFPRKYPNACCFDQYILAITFASFSHIRIR